MWDQFSNLFSGSGGNTPATGFGIQQSATPSFGGFWNNDAPVREFGLEQSYNAMNSPNSSMLSGTTLGANPYQAASPDWFSMGGAFGNGQTGGWAMPALQGLSSMMQWSQGNKALDLAEDQFNLSKEMAQKNLANQTSLLNTAMRDRQNARRSASSSVQDTDSYMANNGI